MIVVGPASHVADLSREYRPSHVLSLVAPGDVPPGLCEDACRLVLAFNDIASPRPGLVHPDDAIVAAILAFGRSWTPGRFLLVHCALGISRSPAAAFILACAADPDRHEAEVAASLRAASPCASPNPLMVDIADRQLGRGGRMRAALGAIGRGADYQPSRGFTLRVNSRRLEPCES